MRVPRLDPRVTVVGLSCALALFGSFGLTSWYLGREARPTLPAVLVALDPVAGSVGAAGPIVVHATGDVLLDAPLLARTAPHGPWSGVSELFRGDDLTIVNLECAPSDLGSAEDKQFTFRCPDGLTDMAESGVEVANLGNNHAHDFGKDALLDGRQRLIRAGVAAVGAGRDSAEANEPAIFELRGRTVAVLGFSGVVPEPGWIATPSRAGVADAYSIESMTRAVRAAAAKADLVLVTIHWGVEKEAEPRASDVARADALIDAGAHAVFGHHPHVLQPLRWHDGKPIFFSLGNFVWPRPGPTAVGRVVIPEEGPIVACMLEGSIRGGRPVLSDPAKTRCSGEEAP